MDQFSQELMTGRAPENGESMPILRLPVGKQLDPLKYRRKQYVINVTIGTQIGDTGENTISIDDSPFMWTKATVGLKDADRTAQDYNYAVRLRDTNRYYQSDFARADLLFGAPGSGVVIPFDVDTFLDSNATVSAEVINQQIRTGTFFVVQFVLHGFERWRK